jgi:hypothetical protein
VRLGLGEKQPKTKFKKKNKYIGQHKKEMDCD